MAWPSAWARANASSPSAVRTISSGLPKNRSSTNAGGAPLPSSLSRLAIPSSLAPRTRSPSKRASSMASEATAMPSKVPLSGSARIATASSSPLPEHRVHAESRQELGNERPILRVRLGPGLVEELLLSLEILRGNHRHKREIEQGTRQQPSIPELPRDVHGLLVHGLNGHIFAQPVPNAAEGSQGASPG